MPDITGKSAGYVGANTKLYWSTDTKATWTLVPETRTVDPADPSVDKADLTHLTSPNKRKEFRPTYIDDGSVTVTCNALDSILDAAGAAIQVAIDAAQGTHNAAYYWKITAENDSAVVHRTWIFPGDIETAKFGPFNGGDPVDFSFSILRTGPTVIT